MHGVYRTHLRLHREVRVSTSSREKKDTTGHGVDEQYGVTPHRRGTSVYPSEHKQKNLPSIPNYKINIFLKVGSGWQTQQVYCKEWSKQTACRANERCITGSISNNRRTCERHPCGSQGHSHCKSSKVIQQMILVSNISGRYKTTVHEMSH